MIDAAEARMLFFEESLREVIEPSRRTLQARGLRSVVLGHPACASELEYEALVESGKPTGRARARPGGLLLQGYTSGTTGFPKGCVNPHRRFADCLKRVGRI